MARERGTGARRLSLLIDLAGKHHGLLTRRQLLDAGLTRNFIDGRVKCGLLCRVHAGVYRFGPVVAAHARERAALLACQGGVLSHRSAAVLWQLFPESSATDPVDVALCTQRHRGVRPGIRVYRGMRASDEITTIDDLPVTTLARTILDIATVSARDLDRALGVGQRLQPRAT
jgi:predicted transcriptional regulator of viral defense system